MRGISQTKDYQPESPAQATANLIVKALLDQCKTLDKQAKLLRQLTTAAAQIFQASEGSAQVVSLSARRGVTPAQAGLARETAGQAADAVALAAAKCFANAIYGYEALGRPVLADRPRERGIGQ